MAKIEHEREIEVPASRPGPSQEVLEIDSDDFDIDDYHIEEKYTLAVTKI